jgi:hypothetical protein
MIAILRKENDQWVNLKFKVSLLSLQLRGFKTNSIYKSLSSGGNKLLGVTNFEWFRNSFDQGFYRCSIFPSYLEYTFFLRVKNLNKYNSVVRQLNIRVRKLGGFSLNLSDMNSIDYVDQILLSSKNGMYAYQKILKTYRN